MSMAKKEVSSRMKSLEVEKIRDDFPILKRKVNGRALAYLDNAASMQKPQVVLNQIQEFYSQHYSNVHRSGHTLSVEATDLYEAVRPKVKNFIGAGSNEEIIFTKGTTEAINLVAHSWARQQLKEGDRIVISRMEHHANFVPWQVLAKELKLQVDIAELDEDFRLNLDDYKKLLARGPKLVALSMMSNVLGGINPVKELTDLAHEAGAVILLDGAQFVIHQQTKLEQLGQPDFLVFSSHKIGGPSGTGVLNASKKRLGEMSPYQYGGDMILEVRDDRITFNEPPHMFEAGTPNMAGVVGMGAAIDYLESIGFEKIEAIESELTQKAMEALVSLDALELVGPKSLDSRGPVFSFVIKGIHPHDLGTILDSHGVAARAGHHCAQPLHFKQKLPASTRASFCFYNTEEEIDQLVVAIQEARKFFR